MRLNGRLRRLENLAQEHGLVTGPGCLACRHRRGKEVNVRSRVGEDGTLLWEEEGPPPCPVCGAVPEVVYDIVEQVVPARMRNEGALCGAPQC
jgi:hypothetical protein